MHDANIENECTVAEEFGEDEEIDIEEIVKESFSKPRLERALSTTSATPSGKGDGKDKEQEVDVGTTLYPLSTMITIDFALKLDVCKEPCNSFCVSMNQEQIALSQYNVNISMY